MVIVAILEVRRAELASFRVFEEAAAAVMREHGGEIERTVVVDGDPFTEIHFVRFPTQSAFDAYRASDALAELRPLRETSVISTKLFIGEDGPVYGLS